MFTPVAEYLPNEAYTYNYDQNGNLSASSKMYDNKLNTQGTNHDWMFIDRDCSVINPVASAACNSSFLPLTFTGT